MAYLGATFRLDPSPQQAAQFERWAGVCRLVWNLALEQRETAWRRQRQRVSWAAQCREIKDLRAAFPFIAKAPTAALHAVMTDLDQAYRNWWAGRAAFPNWKSAKKSAPSVRVKGENARIAPGGRHVWLSKIGLVRARISRDLPGRILSATISRRGEHWYISFACEVVAPAPAPHRGGAIGVDLGVANAAALSSGDLLSFPAPSSADWRRLARWQRRLSRRTGRRGRAEARRRLSRWYERFGNVRTDFINQTVHSLTRDYALIAIEALAVDRMTLRARGRGRAAKAGLNRSMLHRAFGALRTRLAQKAPWTGSRIVAVDPAYTSQTCSACGHVARESRESQAVFRCVACQYEGHADVNAARNILTRAGQAPSHAEGAGSQEGPASNSEPYTTSKEASYVQ
jgi:IS605 OrfB family transposase